MARPYDVTTRDLLRRDPASWLAYLRLDADGPIEIMDADVSTVPAEADRVYRIRGRRAHLVHVEMQSQSDGRLPRRLWRYNALLDLKYDLRVRSVVVLLRPKADSRNLTGVLDLRLPDRDRVATFHYKVIRAWQQPVEPLLAGPLATLPMAPLADVPARDLPRVLERIDSRLVAETTPPEAATMMSSALVLAGMRLHFDVVHALKRRLRTMDALKDSTFWDVIRWEGEVREARKIVIRLGRIRFGRLPKATRAAIEAIEDRDRLEYLSERILTATGWDDLLAEGK